MNIKQLLLPLTLGLLTTLIIQYFFMHKYTASDKEIQSGQTFVAPQSKSEIEPLNREIVLEHQTDLPEIKTKVEAANASYIFSNYGACLDQLTIKNNQGLLQTFDASQLTRENGCFLVALDTNTPYYYNLVDKKVGDNVTHLIYVAENATASITKEFTIHQDTHQIDLKISVDPKKDQTKVRLLYPSPQLQNGQTDTVSALYNSPKGSITKEPLDKIDVNKGWLKPTFFGSEDRYFIHTLVADPDHFAKRAFYTVTNHRLISMLESNPITQKTAWQTSFYYGPKEENALKAVNPDLTQALDYSGWLAPLSRLLLMILKYLYSFLHNYGWAIIAMTLLINIILLPLNLRGARSMKKDMEIQKKLSYVQQRYKDDPDALARERAEIINKHGMPGLGGCLPKLLQLPIFFALSRVLSSSIELHQASFLWMKDLSVPDPYYILSVLIMFSMILVASATDIKQKFMMIAMALVFGAFTAKLSAGLCLYILVGTWLTGIQTALQNMLSAKG